MPIHKFTAFTRRGARRAGDSSRLRVRDDMIGVQKPVQLAMLRSMYIARRASEVT